MKVWAIRFPGNDLYVVFSKSGLLEQTHELDLAESEPKIRVQFSCLFVAVGEQIENHQAPSRAQYSSRCCDCPWWAVCVVQRLAEYCQIDRVVRYRWFFKVTNTIL